MDEQLLILTIDGIEKEIPIEALPITIGRYNENRVVLPYDYVSGEHGQIFFEDGKLFYRDLNSTNGTYIGRDDRTLQFIRNESIRLSPSGRLVFGVEAGAEILYCLEPVERRQGTDVQKVFQKGYAGLKEGNYQRALVCFEKILDRYPQTPIAYYYSAFSASRLDQLDTAILRLEQYLTLRPRDTEAMIDLGKLYERKGNLDKAGTRYQKVLELNPHDHNTQGRLKNLKRYEPVCAPFRKPKPTDQILGSNLVDTVKTQHFVVKYNIARHGRRLNDVLKALEEAYITVGDHLNIYPSNHVPVTLCTDSEGLDEDQSNINAAGTYSKKCIKAILSPRTTFEIPFLRVLLTHEYVHFLIDSILPQGKGIPWWFHEGIAQYESQNLTVDSESIMAEMAWYDSFIPIQVLGKGIQGIEARELSQLAYAQAYSMVDYLIANYGHDAIEMILKDLSAGKSVEKAFEKTCIDYEALETNWRSWLESRLKRGQRAKTKRIR